jgi:uncharacterized protein YfiM (DUF2279 family)
MSFLPPLLCLCLSVSAPPAPRDRWVAEDKLKHFFAAFVVTSLSASAARSAGLQPAASVWVGAGVGTGVGVWKEIRDRGQKDATPSLRDLAWDVAGVGAASALVRQAR